MILCQSCAQSVSKECAVAYNFMSDFAKKQQIENKIYLWGIGHSNPDGKIKALNLDFVAQRKLHVHEARILYINVTQQMLYQVNASEELQCCLDHHPFTVDDLHVSILFKESTGKDVDPPYISGVSTTNGIIHYVLYDSSTDLFFKERFTEPYREALRIVQCEDKIRGSGLNLSCKH